MGTFFDNVDIVIFLSSISCFDERLPERHGVQTNVTSPRIDLLQLAELQEGARYWDTHPI